MIDPNWRVQRVKSTVLDYRHVDYYGDAAPMNPAAEDAELRPDVELPTPGIADSAVVWLNVRRYAWSWGGREIMRARRAYAIPRWRWDLPQNPASEVAS